MPALTTSDQAEALAWILDAANAEPVDVIVLCGNHAFRWHRRLLKQPWCVLHPNALRYTDASRKRVLFLADEIEQGRAAYEAYRQLQGEPLCLRLAALHLNNAPEASQQRDASCNHLSSNDPQFAAALNEIRAWRKYATHEDFHNQGIIGSREARPRRVRPYNADATVYRARSGSLRFEEFAQALSALGDSYRTSVDSTTTFVRDYAPPAPLSANGTVTGLRSLVKLYRRAPPDPAEAAFFLAPMVHSSLTCRRASLGRDFADSFLEPYSTAVRQCLLSTREEDLAASLYDVFGLALDVDLLRWLTSVPDMRLPDSLELEIEESSLLAYYGQSLGRRLLDISGYGFSVPAFARPIAVEAASEVPELTEIDLSQLLSIKSAVHEEFGRENRDCLDPITRRRSGLSFPELSSRIAMPQSQLAIAIDLLCELEWTEPFNRVRVGSEDISVERCYNTTHDGVVSLVARVVKTLRSHSLPTHVSFLNKALAFVGQVVVAGLRGFDGFAVERAPFGKVPRLRMDDDSDGFLDQFLKRYSTTFLRLGNGARPQYALTVSATKTIRESCNAMLSDEYLDPYLEKLVEILRLLLQPVHSTRPATRFAVFVDMLGSKYPESGFSTLGSSFKRVARQEATLALSLAALKEKIAAYRACEDLLSRVHAALTPKVEFRHVRPILSRYAFLLSANPIMQLLQAIIERLDPETVRRAAKAIRRFGTTLSRLGNTDSIQLPDVPESLVWRWIVSIDLRNSRDHALGLLYANWRPYCQHLMRAWASHYGGEKVDLPGDEGIFAFVSENEALSFAGVAWNHLNGLGDTVMSGMRWGIGISSGRVHKLLVGDQSTMMSGAEEGDAIGDACRLKSGTQIQQDVGGSIVKHDPATLFGLASKAALASVCG